MQIKHIPEKSEKIITQEEKIILNLTRREATLLASFARNVLKSDVVKAINNSDRQTNPNTTYGEVSNLLCPIWEQLNKLVDYKQHG